MSFLAVTFPLATTFTDAISETQTAWPHSADYLLFLNISTRLFLWKDLSLR